MMPGPSRAHAVAVPHSTAGDIPGTRSTITHVTFTHVITHVCLACTQTHTYLEYPHIKTL